LRVDRERALPRRPNEALQELRADVLLRRPSLEADGVVSLTVGVAEAVKRHPALPAEVEGRFGPVLEDRDDVRARLPELVVLPAQLGEVLAAEGSAETAHEGHYERTFTPALGDVHHAERWREGPLVV